ncbi:hypothetical protein ACIBFB_20045 [Nocardiopsis sp. NPDC050513]|uniref:TPR repeat region-containing protein n=1 Tax=Nocardiopsis sp. NPDC050513 TaxID=3364338 RepID=UPI00378A890B
MASFQLLFAPRTISAHESQIRPHIEQFNALKQRLLGRADNLEISFESAGTHFTDLIAWDITSLGAEDYQLWVDSTGALEFAADTTEMWADYVKEFWDTNDDLWDEWDAAVAAKVAEVPEEYQGETITADYPARENRLESIFGGDANKCRDLYDELQEKLDDINERAQANYDKHQEHAAEIGGMLEQGATDVNVQRLIDGGYSTWSYSNIDPERYLELESDFELTPESGRNAAEELEPYFSGEKPLDDRYHELMLVLAMVGTNARNAQNDGSELENGEIEFLDAFYDRLEQDQGVIDIPRVMEGDHLTDEEREHALGVLGDGLLALSDPNLGGGYENLPQSVRNAIDIPFPADGETQGDLTTHEGDARTYALLSELFAHASDDLEGGYGLSTNLALSAGMYMGYWGDSSAHWVSERDLGILVDVATRNKDANYFMLTGDHLNPEIGVDYHEDDRTTAIEGLFTYEWGDYGTTVRQLTDWLAEDINSDDYQEVSRAGRGFAGFMETMTDPDMYESLINTGVHIGEGGNDYQNASFTHFNTELANSLADIFDAHIYSFATSDIWEHSDVPVEGVGRYEYDIRFVRMGPEERAMYMQYLVGNDETAGRLVNSVDVYQQLEAMAFLESGQDENTARGAGTLQGLLEEALRRDSQDRTDDLGEQVDRNKEIAGFVVDELGSQSEKIPVIGAALSQGMGLASDSIVDAIIDGEFEVSPRDTTYSSPENIERNFSLEALDYLARNNPDELNNVVRPDEFQTLVEGGGIVIERNGEILGADDINEDFVIDSSVTITVEKNPGAWESSAQRDGGLDDMDAALGRTMDDVEITTSDGRSKPGNDRVQDFVRSYNDLYGETNDFFNLQGEEEGEEE